MLEEQPRPTSYNGQGCCRPRGRDKPSMSLNDARCPLPSICTPILCMGAACSSDRFFEISTSHVLSSGEKWIRRLSPESLRKDLRPAPEIPAWKSHVSRLLVGYNGDGLIESGCFSPHRVSKTCSLGNVGDLRLDGLLAVTWPGGINIVKECRTETVPRRRRRRHLRSGGKLRMRIDASC